MVNVCPGLSQDLVNHFLAIPQIFSIHETFSSQFPAFFDDVLANCKRTPSNTPTRGIQSGTISAAIVSRG